MNVRLGCGLLSASFDSVCLGSAKVVYFGLALLAGVISGCGDGKPSVPPLNVATSSLTSGQVGTAYSASLSAIGGTTPYQWSLRSGTLPAGLTFNSSSGAIVGRPTVYTNQTPLVFGVSDSSQHAETATVSLSLTIAPLALAISTTTLPNGQMSQAYSASLAASGGRPGTGTLGSKLRCRMRYL